MPNVLDTLTERGYIYQISDEDGLRRALERPISLYCGYDPTAPSYHIGNLLSIMMLTHFQRAGHRPIAVVGGGTGMVGDPSGKTAQRPILTREEIGKNLTGQRSQLQRYLSFDEGRALMLNNADWLLELNYIRFLREIGRHFSVNQMLTAEAYKTRLETGLSFLEFNYMLLQAYDFLHLFKTHSCVLQIGGSDQWANCLAGTDLIRRTEGGDAFVLVAPLLTTATGQKMGKTESGSVWLDADLTSPYDFYQYWVNVDDRDVERLLALYTFLPMHEVRRLGALEGADIRQAKEILAFEATSLTHGAAAAERARRDSGRLFRRHANTIVEVSTTATVELNSGDNVQTIRLDGIESGEIFGEPSVSGEVSSTRLDREQLHRGVSVVSLLVDARLAPSRAAARRLIDQGGAYLNEERVTSPDATITAEDVRDGAVLLRAGKKRYHRVVID